MRIRKIEILGFKSFPDKIILLFDQPITAVVGPNGCGKSNIVDAIRWCMGEQSAHKLRGKAMEDIIFAGSDTRGPSGMAEVSLTFVNDDGNVPLQFSSYHEITVTRRLFRDGRATTSSTGPPSGCATSSTCSSAPASRARPTRSSSRGASASWSAPSRRTAAT